VTKASVITYIEGRIQTVPADDPRVVEQEKLRVRLHHVANMRRLDLHGRRDYLANVERREGAESRAALEAAFAHDWSERRNSRQQP
jgi:hypothetical protein